MSGTERAGVLRTARQDAREGPSASPKPSHVRRLNFGQSLLALNVVHDAVEQKGNRLIIDNDVTNIPCTEKSEFVRKWVETHGQERRCALQEENLSTSPVLGSSKRVRTSPVLGHGRKRARRGVSKNDIRVRSVRNDGRSKDGRAEQPDSTFCSRDEQLLDGSDENSKENVFEHRSTPVKCRTAETSSPVLGKERRWSFRKRRLWDQRKPLGPVACNYMDNNMNSVIVDHDLSTRRADCEILSTEKQDMLLKKLEMDMDLERSECEVKETIKNFRNSFSIRSPLMTKKSCVPESPDITESSPRIETGSSDETKDLFEDIGDVDNDSDKTPSDVIEDINTQDVLCVQQNPHNVNHFYEVVSKQSQKDLPSLSSERISEVLTPTNEVVDDRSNRTDMISTVTSPEAPELEPTKSLTILDSCKKRRKAKKGSLSEKLHTLINSQVSFVRIWRHQMRQTSKDGGSIKCITVCIRECTTHFNRQFSSGFVIDDPFELLPRSEAHEADRTGTCPRREIRIMTIPEIVGRIDVRSESVVQIAPPWEILEDKRLFLHVTYLNKSSGVQKVDVEGAGIKGRKRATLIANEFDCACIRANKLLKNCDARTDKPNVMEALFSL